MPVCRYLVFVLAAALLVVPPVYASSDSGSEPAADSSGAQASNEPADAPEAGEAPARPQRVILTLSRKATVNGVLELEDDQVLVIKTTKGELQSYAKARVLEIIRLVEPGEGQDGVVLLRNGQVREGLVLKDDWDFVLIEIEGIRARLSRPSVHHVILEPTFEEKYEAFKAVISPGMVTEQLRLCRWLMDERAYELARVELEKLLDHEEDSNARRLLRITNAQLLLEQPAGETTEGHGDEGRRPGPERRDSGPVLLKDLLPKQLLSEADVNVIRVYEIDMKRPPRVSVTPDTIRRLVEAHGTNSLIPASQTERTALFRAEPIQIVKLMFRLEARDFYPQVEVMTEPYALNMFRQRVHNTWLMNNCATSRCHGGLDGGRLFLHRRSHKSDRVRYTNLLILERLELDPQWPLINYADPEMSLIIQYATARELARLPHPDVPGWRPVFRHANERLRTHAVEWIRAMMQPRPVYPVDYEPPVIRANDPEDDPSSPDDRTAR